MARIALVGDSPRITSGFGVCNRMVCDMLLADGHEVYVLGNLDFTPDHESPYHVWPAHPSDPLNERALLPFIQKVDPDLIIVHQDPGLLMDRLMHIGLVGGGIMNAGDRYRVLSWFPIEGAPVHPRYVDVPRFSHRSYCYTNFGVDSIKPHIPEGTHLEKQTLGWDHADFRMFSKEARDHLKYICGMENYFLVGNVAVNKRGNRHPMLMLASRQTAAKEIPALYYMHTDPRENLGLQGPNLEALQIAFDADHCWFKGDGRTAYDGIAYDDTTTEEAYLALERPETPAERKVLFDSLPLIAKYNMMDLYIDPSSVQGYNLPTVEAAACGVRIVSVDDFAARSELFDDLAVAMMTPDAWDTWHTGAMLALVSAEQIASVVTQEYTYKTEQPEAYEADRVYTAAVAKEHFRWDLSPMRTGINELLATPLEALKTQRTFQFASPMAPFPTVQPDQQIPEMDEETALPLLETEKA